jgi:hypothetical protein
MSKIAEKPCICGHRKGVHRLNDLNQRQPGKKYPCFRLACDCKNYRPAARERGKVSV